MGVMAWDDELDHLTTSVGDLLGEDVLSAAVSRAIRVALHTQLLELSSPVELKALTDRGGVVTSMSALYDALRIELRRLLQPQ
jgi:hypothetical protein